MKFSGNRRTGEDIIAWLNNCTGKLTAFYLVFLLLTSFLTVLTFDMPLIQHVKAEKGGPTQGEGTIEELHGNWTVEAGDHLYYGNRTLNLTGNLTVHGSLTLQNVTIWFNCSSDGEHGIFVENGGSLVIRDNDDNRDTTADRSYINSMDLTHRYIWQVKAGSNFTFKNSYLAHCGLNSQIEYTGLYINSNNSYLDGNIMAASWGGIILSGVEDCIISNNTFAGLRKGVRCMNQTSDCVIWNNTFMSGWDDVYIEDSSNITVSNNTFRTICQSVSILGSENCTIWNNTRLPNNANTIKLSNSNDTTIGGNNLKIEVSHSKRNYIADNNCSNVNIGLKLDYSCDNQITNNTCGTNEKGMVLYYSEDNTLTNNTCDSNTGIGLLINYDSHNNIVSKNTCISNDGGGIYIDDSENNEIRSNNCSSNPQYGIKVGGKYNDVIYNNCTLNNGDGILSSGDYNNITRNNCTSNNCGVKIDSSDNNRVTENYCVSNLWFGIWLDDSKKNNIHNNNLSRNDNSVFIDDSIDNRITNNTCHSSLDDGIYLVTSDLNQIHNNSINSSGGRGIYLSSSDNNNLTNNVFTYSKSTGLFLSTSHGNNVTDCIGTSNDGDGMHIWGSDNNMISNNSIDSNLGCGIYMDDMPIGNNITNTSCSNNGGNGISLYQGRNNLLSDNTCESNKKLNLIVNQTESLTMKENVFNGDGMGMFGTSKLFWNTHSIDTTNLVNGKPIVYWKDAVGGTVPTGASQVILAGCKNVLVENQEMDGRFMGITVAYSDDNTIANNQCNSSTLYGIYIYRSASNNITDNFCNSSSGSGMYFYRSNLNNITNNNCNSSSGSGMYFYWSGSNNISNNTCSNNGFGLHLNFNSNNNHIAKNSCPLNEYAGIMIDDSEGNDIDGNHCEHMNGSGIHLSGSCSNNLVRNNCNSNEGQGIQLSSSSIWNALKNNTVCSNNISGIYVTSSGYNILENNIIEDNIVGVNFSGAWANDLIDNDFHSNRGDGIYVYGSNSEIINNTFYSNKKNGIYLNEGSSPSLIVGNVFKENIEYGIHFGSGIDGRSRIHHNIFLENNNNGVQARNDGSSQAWADSNDPDAEGNFWSDYTSRYPYARNDGIKWNTPYKTAGGNQWDSDDVPLLFTSVGDDILPELVLDNSTDNATTGDNFRLDVGVTDNYGVIMVWATYTDRNMKFHNVSLPKSGIGRWSINFTVDPGATYVNYSFEALDAGKNWRRFNWTNVTVEDNDPPVFMCESLNGSPTTGGRFDFKARFSDNMGISGAMLNYTLDGLSFIELPMKNLDSEWWEESVEVPLQGGTIEYYYYFEDISGNHNLTSPRIVEVMDDDFPGLLADNSSLNPTTGDEYIFMANFHDNLNISGAMVYYSFDSSNYSRSVMERRRGFEYSTPVTIDDHGKRLFYYFIFEDTSGNRMLSAERNLTISDNDRPYLLGDESEKTTSPGDIFEFYLRAVDNMGLIEASVNYTFDDLTYHCLPLVRVSPEVWKGQVNVPPTSTSLKYLYRFADNASNFNETSTFNIPVIVRDPVIPLRDKSPQFPTTGDNFTFSVEVSGDLVFENIHVIYRFDNGHGYMARMGRTSGDEWQGTILVSPHTNRMEYYFFLEDSWGNVTRTNETVLQVLDNDAPVAKAGGRRWTKTGENIFFSSIGSTDNKGIWNCSWSFTYDCREIVLFGSTIWYNFNNGGNYSIELKVTDKAGNWALDMIEISVVSLMEKVENITNESAPVEEPTTPDVPTDEEARDENATTNGSVVCIIRPVSEVPGWFSLSFPLLLLIAVFIIAFATYLFTRSKQMVPGPSPTPTFPVKEGVVSPKGSRTVVDEEEKDDNGDEEDAPKAAPPIIDADSEVERPDRDDLEHTQDMGNVPMCLTCHGLAEYYSEYDCYWCENCQDYIDSNEDGFSGDQKSHPPFPPKEDRED